MTRAIYNALEATTTKGKALKTMMNNQGAKEICSLRLAANVADRETITIGQKVFRVVQINTDTTANVSGGQLNNTKATVAGLVAASHGVTLGEVIRVENEFMLVTNVRSDGIIDVERGYAGSTIAAHADGTDIYRKGATAVTSTDTWLPVGGTLTPAAAGPQLAAAITALSGFGITASYLTNEILMSRDAQGNTLQVAETLAGANNAVDATFRGGVEPGEQKYAVSRRVATAQEVALGVAHFVFPFDVARHRVTVFTTGTGAAVAWGGTVTISGGRVTLTNGTDPDFSVNETLVVEAFG